ncbi:MAG TPA: hypothetical protein PKC43_13160 [Phycisphaerales bacterium]|nr:hypothetical protein [Phycisphaerales bacterium]HMP38381.1 hypothetical protein [Phycisphaerales bacterium]
MSPRTIQAIALAAVIAATALGGTLVPRLTRMAEDATLRYTDDAIAGAPPIVQLGTAIGALRGLIVNYLWLKVNARKQEGLFYEILTDSELITKLQPRFPEVWAFLGHNMAYNISVMTNTPEERWEWVNAGIRLVRERGLRYNPNDVVLHKELAFWFAHKLDGVADDAHLFYKREFAREWHLLLGPPPVTHAERAEWMREIADAPATMAEAIRGRPALTVPVDAVARLIEVLQPQVDRVRERENRRMTGRETIDLLRPTIDSLGISPAAAAELRRLVQAVDGGDDALRRLRRLEADRGELIPAFAGEPRVAELVQRLERDLEPFGPKFRFRPDREFLANYGRWASVATSRYAQLLGLRQVFLANDPVFRTFEAIGQDPEFANAWRVLLAHLRKRALLDEFNMDPRLMFEYTRDLGPLDWRHPQSHALFFSRRGSQFGTKRYEDEEDVYKILNNDRLQIQAMQALARSGLMSVDPFSNDNPGRLSDVRWIKVIDRYFAILYDRYYGTRGGGGDSFTNFHENFMKQALRELYRAGDIEGAQAVLDDLDRRYGSGGIPPHGFYRRPIDIVVHEVTYQEYEAQPDVARTDVYAALTRGFREGILGGNERVLRDAMTFADQVTTYFKSTMYTDFVNKFGEARLGALIGSLDDSVRNVLMAVLTDPTMPLLDRLFIYSRVNEAQQRMVYDEVRALLAAEYERDPLSLARGFDTVFLEPPGMEEYRVQRAEAARRRESQQQDRSTFERR